VGTRGTETLTEVTRPGPVHGRGRGAGGVARSITTLHTSARRNSNFLILFPESSQPVQSSRLIQSSVRPRRGRGHVCNGVGRCARRRRCFGAHTPLGTHSGSVYVLEANPEDEDGDAAALAAPLALRRKDPGWRMDSAAARPAPTATSASASRVFNKLH
jgi:hypothetical protein